MILSTRNAVKWTRPADPASKTKDIASQRFRQHLGRTGVSGKKLVIGTEEEFLP
jgi:hypothetical protein